MKYGEMTCRVVHGYVRMPGGTACTDGFAQTLDVCMMGVRSVTLKAFDAPGDRADYRRLVAVNSRRKALDGQGYLFEVTIEGRRTQIYASELEALGIEPEPNIKFYLEVWT